jgi:hypothetical protein
MKVSGVLAGRKMGNCEVLAKEAFMAAAEMGADSVTCEAVSGRYRFQVTKY